MSLGDPFVSRSPIRFAPRVGGGLRLIAGSDGTRVVVGSPVKTSIDLTAEDLALGTPIELAGRVVLLAHLLDPNAGDPAALPSMVGDGDAIRRVRTAIERVVDLSVPVLIRGETGTGKELVARAIHDQSPRRDRPFVSVNLGALPRELAVAELFGATKGAFTGSVRDREGLFRVADGGTLFLDEVGEAPPEVQVSLLRVLETGEMYPVGSDRPVATHVRIIAATDADLEDRIREGRFRAPLLHRLAGYELWVPALRSRREDIGPLFYHFAREELSAIGEGHRLSPQDPYTKPWLPAPLAASLLRHAWPGNIRQLRNLVRQLVIGSRGLTQLQPDARIADELAVTPAPSDAEISSERRKPSEVTEEELLEALRASAWDIKSAADRLRIPRPSIYDLIEKSSNIRTAGDLGADEIADCFRELKGDLDAMAAKLQVSKRALGRRVKELGLSMP